jgi:autotransporter-associated beta strand protein
MTRLPVVWFACLRFTTTLLFAAATVAVAPLAEAQVGSLSDAEIVAWGRNSSGQSSAPTGYGFVDVAAGDLFGVARRSDGSLVTWGSGSYGEHYYPGGSFTAVDGGGYHGLAVRSDGGISGWGYNYYGQANSMAGAFKQAAGGLYHSVALRVDGSLMAWGDNTSGQIIVPGGSNFTQISAGSYHSLALRSDGTIAAWGAGGNGQTNVPAGNTYSQVAAGNFHSLAIRNDGSLAGWGYNDYGQSAVPTGTNFVKVAGGGYHSLALRNDGSLAAWGNNLNGQCNVPSGYFLDIDAGEYHSVGLRARQSYQDLLVQGTGSQALLQRTVFVNGNASIQSTLTLANNPTMYVYGQFVIDASTAGTGYISASGPNGLELRSGSISADIGANSITKTTSATATLGKANTSSLTVYSGTLNLEGRLSTPQVWQHGGTINIGDSGSLWYPAQLWLYGGDFQLNGQSATVGGLRLEGGNIAGPNGSTLLFNGGDFMLNAGGVAVALAGVGGVTKTTAGTVTLSGNNTYSGTTGVYGGTLNVTGSLADNGSAKVLVAKDTSGAFGDGAGEISLIRRVAASASYAGFGSSVANLGAGEIPTAADILAGNASAQADVAMAWRTRSAAEKSADGGGLIGEVLRLDGLAGDAFVLQMSYDEAALQSIWELTEAEAVAQNRLYLGWLHSGGDGLVGTDDDRWLRAVEGNTGGAANFVGDVAYDSSHFSLGNYGVDTTRNVVWAVVDHNSQFAPVPEPSTLLLLVVGVLGWLGCSAWRRQ